MECLAHLQVSRCPLAREFQTLANNFMRIEENEKGRFLSCVEARSSFLDKINCKKFNDEKLIRIRDKVLRGEAKEAKIDEEGVLRIKGRVCVPRVDDLINTVLIEAHSSRYSIHLGATKMYLDLKQHFWCSRMKRDIMDFIAKCPNYQQVKYEHQRPGEHFRECPFLNGSGKGLQWISWLVFQRHWESLIPFG